jgi:hypothetical protein
VIQGGRDSVQRMAVTAFESPLQSKVRCEPAETSEYMLLEDEVIQVLKYGQFSLPFLPSPHLAGRSQYDVIFGQYLEFVANEKAYMHFYQSCYRYKVPFHPFTHFFTDFYQGNEFLH